MTKEEFKAVYRRVRLDYAWGNTTKFPSENYGLIRGCLLSREYNLDAIQFSSNKYLFMNLRFENMTFAYPIFKFELRSMLTENVRESLPLP